MTHEPAPFDRPALLLSLSLHAAAALLCAVAFASGSFALGARDTTAERDEPMTIVRFATPRAVPTAIVVVPTMIPMATPRAVAAARPLVLPPVPHPHANVYVVHARDTVAAPSDTRAASAAGPSAAPLRIVAVNGPDAGATTAASATAAPIVEAAATPTPTVRPSEPPALGASGPGVFGQNRRADLASGVSAAELAEIAGGRFHVRITVDENGRAREVEFLATPRNAEDLRRRLLAAKYLPAECDGLYCEGTLDLRG